MEKIAEIKAALDAADLAELPFVMENTSLTNGKV